MNLEIIADMNVNEFTTPYMPGDSHLYGMRESDQLSAADDGIRIISRNNYSALQSGIVSSDDVSTKSDPDQIRIWLSAVPLVTLMIVNFFANGAIILIFIKQRCIRRCRNIYILSIAIADFLIGLSMPFSITETLHQRWTFWPFSCWVFVMVRYSLFFISFMSIILLTVDRWWSINFPFSYRIRQSRKMASCLVVCCWLVSFILHIPLVLGWSDANLKEFSSEASFCKIPDERNFIFTVCSFFIEYIIPMTILVLLNLGIYLRLLKRRNTKKLRRSLSTNDSYMLYSRKTSSDSGGSNINNNISCEDTSEMGLISHNIITDNRRHTVYLYNARKLSTISQKNSKNFRYSPPNVIKHPVASKRYSMDTTSLIKNKSVPNGIMHRPSFPTRKQSDDVVKDYLVRQDKKAILSLGLLTTVAFVCWTPYAIVGMVSVYCEDCVPSWVSMVFYWVLAANSAINPFLYGIGNPDFRKVLRAWVSCCTIPGSKLQDSLLYCQAQQTAELETLQEYQVGEQPKIETL